MSAKKTSIFTDKLVTLGDEGYRDFTGSLIPNLDKERIIGIRIPILRKLAKEVWKEDLQACQEFLQDLPHFYFEENNLQVLLISNMADFDQALEESEKFIPHLDNWASCDLLLPKAFKGREEDLQARIEEWLGAEEVYVRRWAIRLLIAFYSSEYFSDRHLGWIVAARSDEYYVNMARAWYICEILVKHYEYGISLLEDRKLDSWTHNKAIQKACESLRLDEEKKEQLRGLRS